jgi:hypothetical protein
MSLLSNSHLASVPGLGSLAPIIRRDLMPRLVILEKFEPGASLSLRRLRELDVMAVALLSPKIQ